MPKSPKPTAKAGTPLVAAKAASRSKASTVTHSLSLAVQYACNSEALPSRPRIRRWVKATLERPAEVTIRFVDAEEGQGLNRDYRGKDYATNVLSFVYETEPVVLGDLVVCLPVVQREAQEQGKTLDAHFAHMIVHGILHLHGDDHETSVEDAEAMEAKERMILARLGYPDPYQ
jgi:probable rRNA maturation factor